MEMLYIFTALTVIFIFISNILQKDTFFGFFCKSNEIIILNPENYQNFLSTKDFDITLDLVMDIITEHIDYMDDNLDFIELDFYKSSVSIYFYCKTQNQENLEEFQSLYKSIKFLKCNYIYEKQ